MYKTFNLLASIDGEAMMFEFPAVSLDAALADLQQAFAGEVKLIQWGTK